MNIKRFNQFISENKDTQDNVYWQDLPLSVRNDITENLMGNIKYLQENYWNAQALVETIDGLIKEHQPMFKIKYKRVDDLYNELSQIGWGISEDNVDKLMNILKSGRELHPVILNNNKFFDGGHRLTAYKRLRKELIPTIDIGFMLKFDWEKFDNDEIDFLISQ